MTWRNESQRHELASRGVKTKEYKLIANGEFNFWDWMVENKIQTMGDSYNDWPNYFIYDGKKGHYLYSPDEDVTVFMKYTPFTPIEIAVINKNTINMEDE